MSRTTPADQSRQRHEYWIDWPVPDMRPMLLDNQGRIPKPAWPDPRINVEYLRGCGAVRLRPGGPVRGWEGERSYCDARGILPFPKELLPAGFSLAVRRVTAGPGGYRTSVAFRDELSRPSDNNELRLASVRVSLAGDRATLGSVGGHLATYLERATTSCTRRAALADCPWRMTPGLPAVLMVTKDESAGSRIELLGVPTPRILPSACVAYELRYGPDVGQPLVRSVRASILRLHAELEFLREARRVSDTLPGAVAPDSMSRYLASVSKVLNRKHRDKLPQPPLVALELGVNGFAESDLDYLARDLKRNAKGLARQFDILLERAANARETGTLFTVNADQVNLTIAQKGSTVSKYEFHEKIIGSAIGDNASTAGIGGSSMLVFGSSTFDATLLAAEFSKLASLEEDTGRKAEIQALSDACIQHDQVAVQSGLAKFGSWIIKIGEGIGVGLLVAAAKSVLGL